MAITKIHAIKRTVNKSISYIINPEKTDGYLLVSSYNCEAMTAALDFKMTAALAKEVKGDYKKVGGSDNLAYHMIQSFSPTDKVSPQEAHEIGKKLADEFLGGKFEYVISTHIDKGHIHNHIIINAVSFYDFKKLRTQPYKTAAKIRAISDRLCTEHDLSVIKEPKKLGYSYFEYMKRKKDNRWKAEVRKKLNFALERSLDYQEFKKYVEALEIEINDNEDLKYRPEDRKDFEAASNMSDEETYTKNGVLNRVAMNAHNKSFIENAIKECAKVSDTLEEFELKLKDVYSIQMKKNKDKEISYIYDENIIKENILNDVFKIENIKIAIKEKEFEFNEVEKEVDILKEYTEMTKTKVAKEETCILLEKENIVKVTMEGILIEAEDKNGVAGKIFIPNTHVNYIEPTNDYEIYLGEQFNYYFMNEDIDPDIVMTKQLSDKYLKGEDVVRSLELKNGVLPEEIFISGEDIHSINSNGLTISIPESGIERMFIENKYVKYDSINNTCTVSIYDNWNYNYVIPPENENQDLDPEIKKKTLYDSYKGSGLIGLLEKRWTELNEERENGNGLDDLLNRKLKAFEKRSMTEETKELAASLLFLRKEKIKEINEFDLKINEILEKTKEIRSEMKTLDEKNNQYKEAAKYLVAYNKYLPIKIEYEKKSFITKDKFYKKNESELLAFEHAVKQLEKLKVNTNVDPEKVIGLVKQQNKKIEELRKLFKIEESRIEELQKNKSTIENVIDEKNRGKDDREQEQEMEH